MIAKIHRVILAGHPSLVFVRVSVSAAGGVHCSEQHFSTAGDQSVQRRNLSVVIEYSEVLIAVKQGDNNRLEFAVRWFVTMEMVVMLHTLEDDVINTIADHRTGWDNKLPLPGFLG